MTRVETPYEDWVRHTVSYLQGHKTVGNLEETADLYISRVICYVEEHSPFYGRHLAKRTGPDSRYAVLGKVPVTTKDNLRDAGMDICSMPMNEVATYYETTGTTGAPTPCPRAVIDVQTSGFYVQRAMAHAYNETFGTNSVMTAIMGPSELYAFGDTYGEICRNLGIPFVRLWPESPRVGLEKAADCILKLGVQSLICSPAVALALSRFYISKGIDPQNTPVRQVFVLGELCTPEMITNIGRIWDANCTHGLYGSQEAHAVATGCPHGNLHLSETNYAFEVLPVSGVEAGIGEMCLTMLVPGAKPLIRFQTGDLVTIEADCACDCASRVLKVFGRVTDLVMLGGKKVLPSDIESAILGAVDRSWGYQVAIRETEDGLDWLEISMAATLDHDAQSQTRTYIAEALGVPVTLTLADKLDPRTETGAYVSWKHARIRDERAGS